MTGGATASGPAWAAGVLLYSGRPDPSWYVAAATAAALVARFERLPAWGGPVPDVARLGYRGAWLRAPDGRRWIAFEGVAWPGPPGQARRDEGRALERAILATAPPGAIPQGVPLGPGGRD